MLIGAEATATGYVVAWQVAGADLYAVWNTDSSGNYLNNATGGVSGSSVALQSLETSFYQDLNRDGVIGISSGSIAIANTDAFVFRPDMGIDVDVSANSVGTAAFVFDDSSLVADKEQLAALLKDSASSQSYASFESVNVGHDEAVNPEEIRASDFIIQLLA
ncbi:MAG: hypothetical protein FD165_2906 [Gammaproteobacteria bacterium]|nr:MAG: hypothetical protein FD165_2906 [Gammaproteobacteria bacterium]